MIRIRGEHLEAIKRHAESEYPNECCGLLIGTLEDDGNSRVVMEIYPTANSWEDGSQTNRMLISPLDYARAERESVAKGMGVIGDYHSHPDDRAVPSRFDLENTAWPMTSHIVVSIRAGKATDLRSWALADDRSRFVEEQIVKGT